MNECLGGLKSPRRVSPSPPVSVSVVREAVQAGIFWSELKLYFGMRRLFAKTCTVKKSNSKAEYLVVGRKRIMNFPVYPVILVANKLFGQVI